jgi:hypothetical protein
LEEEAGEFSVRATFDHPYPTTKIIWIPDNVSIKKERNNHCIILGAV